MVKKTHLRPTKPYQWGSATAVSCMAVKGFMTSVKRPTGVRQRTFWPQWISGLATRSGVNGRTLLIWVCEGSRDNPQLALGLLERRADVLARNKNNGKDALMGASQNGHIAVCTFFWKKEPMCILGIGTVAMH